MFSPGSQPIVYSPLGSTAGSPSSHPYQVRTITDPTQDELRALALEHTPCVLSTAQGNVLKVAKNKARKAKWTYVIATEDEASHYSCGIIDRARADALIGRQRAYIEEQGTLIEVRGFLGLGP